MSEFAIKVENLSKSYRIRKEKGERYTALRDVVSERTNKFFKQLSRGKNPFLDSLGYEDFWALKDVSFELQKGEVLGVIGRNGAGKSTLLKILSRITEPTKGRLILNGRVASLLEVGTGFHPELTGRENIFLSGSILGMTRKEIKKRFDEIVDFAGVETFIDMPVKHYSSGMYLRLGFAVAAHLETEIILLDEILAVGDIEFQKKCINVMKVVADTGKSVLVVSHNLNLVDNLCFDSIFLDKGNIIYKGRSEEAIFRYSDVAKKTFLNKTNNIKNIQFLVNRRKGLTCKSGESIILNVYFKFDTPLIYPVLGIVVKNENALPLIGINNCHYDCYFKKEIEEGMISVEIKRLPQLVRGYYTIDVYLGDFYGDREYIQEAVKFYFDGGLVDFGSQKNLNILSLQQIKWTVNEYI